jgi:hypothetical protein
MVLSMTYYLLVFDRRRGRLVEDVREFSDAAEAMKARLLREADSESYSPDIEVVVLGAGSIDALRNTHSRYFGSPNELQEV